MTVKPNEVKVQDRFRAMALTKLGLRLKDIRFPTKNRKNPQYVFPLTPESSILNQTIHNKRLNYTIGEIEETLFELKYYEHLFWNDPIA